VLHFLWMRSSKHRYGEVLLYGGILGVLLVARVAPLMTWLRARVGRTGPV
jgi:DMSO/TMAO reductase YedYZ heme-binding membrane subunit